MALELGDEDNRCFDGLARLFRELAEVFQCLHSTASGSILGCKGALKSVLIVIVETLLDGIESVSNGHATWLSYIGT